MALLAGVNYPTGQVHDIPRLTAAVHEAGAVVGWDLRTRRQRPARLHDWDVDFAMWCTYKYLNAGPGASPSSSSTSGTADPPSLVWRAGGATSRRPDSAWPRFDPGLGADGWQDLKPPILALAPVRASLAIFDEVGMHALRAKSLELTAYLEGLLDPCAGAR